MEFKVGDRFFNTITGECYEITFIGAFYYLWKTKYNGDWILVTTILSIKDLELQIKKFEILPDTATNRILYGPL